MSEDKIRSHLFLSKQIIRRFGDWCDGSRDYAIDSNVCLLEINLKSDEDKARKHGKFSPIFVNLTV